MAAVSPLAPFTIFKPGSLGLVDRNAFMGNAPPQFDEVSQNTDLGADGSLVPRAVFRKYNIPSYTDLMGSDLTTQFGNWYVYSNTAIYKITTGGSRIDITTYENTPGDLGTWSKGWWMYASLGVKEYFFQEGYTPRVMDSTSPSNPDARMMSGSPPQGGIVHSAFGRLWVAKGTGGSPLVNDNKLYWSALLDGETWTGTGTGSLDLSIYMDKYEYITGITDFNRLLVVFTTKRIILFSNPFNVPVDLSGSPGTVETMSMKETIDNTGCIGRRMYVKTGTDLFFASKYGLLSLGRVMQEGGSNPLNAISGKIENIWKAWISYVESNYLNAIGGIDFAGATAEPCMSYLPYSNSIMISSGTNLLGTVSTGIASSYNMLSSDLLFHLSNLTEGVPAITRWVRSGEGVGIIGPMEESSTVSGSDAAVSYQRYALIQSVNFSYRGICYSSRTTSPDDTLVVDNFTFITRTPSIYFGDQVRDVQKILKRALLTVQPPWTNEYPNFNVPCVFNTYTNFRQDAYTYNFNLSSVPGITTLNTTKSIPLQGDGFSCQFEFKASVTTSNAANLRYEILALQAKTGRLNQGI